VSYILAFNVPPVEITGTALILVRVQRVSQHAGRVRAGMASMAQISSSLDEASPHSARAA
jgi:iron(III) transport system permease protein